MKALSKKSKKGIGVAVGVGAAGITAYLIYRYLKGKPPEDHEPDPAEEPFVIPEIPISLENILLIIQDVTLTTMEKIAILESMYNEQFITTVSQQAEIVQIEAEILIVDEEIVSVLSQVVPYENTVAAKLILVNSAQSAEATAYDAYIEANNRLDYLLNRLAECYELLDNCFPLDLVCLIREGYCVQNYQEHVAEQEPIVSGLWNTYLDKEQLRKEAENDYNSAILALELFKEENLFPLQEQKIVLTNSLTMWKIAYQAANNVLSELIKQLEILGVSV